MSVVSRFWPDNPVLTKELRVRMRGSRAYWILTGYLAFLSFILFIQYTTWWHQARSAGSGFSSGSKIGQEFFNWIFFTQLFLVAFITPAITSGAITIEKEQRTMEMLEMTRLSRASIVAGKLFSAVSFVSLLLISSLPITSICFFLGGVSPEEVFLRYSLLFGISFITATLGMVWSSVARTTAAAVVFTYSSLLVPFILLIIFGFATSGAGGGSGAMSNVALLAIIAAGMFGVYFPETMGFSSASGLIHAWDMRHFYGMTLPVWLGPVTTFILIGLTLAAVAVARLETFPERKAGTLRLLVLAAIAQQTLFILGARFAVHAGNAPPGAAAAAAGFPTIFMLVYPVALLLLAIPVFATGEVRPIEARKFTKYLVSGWTPAGLKRGRIASGLPYLICLALTIFTIYVLSFVFIGRPAAAFKSPAALTGQAPSLGQVQVMNPDGTFRVVKTGGAVAPPVGSAADLAHIAIATIAAIIGLSSLGLLFSVACRNRWAALALLYAVLLTILIAPTIAHANFVSRPVGTPSVFMNLYYLNPLMSIAEATDVDGRFWTDMTVLLGHAPFWSVTTVLYLFITGVSLLLALPFVTKIASGPVLAYEDMAARV